MWQENLYGNQEAYASYRLLFYKSEVSVFLYDLGTRYFRLKRKVHRHINNNNSRHSQTCT